MPTVVARRAVLASAGVAMCALSACGGNESGGSPSVGGSPTSSAQPSASPAGCTGGSACVTINVSLTGAVTASGVDRQPRVSCADILTHTERLAGQTLLSLPSPRVVGTHQLAFAVAILPFRGPGAYTKEVTLAGESDSLFVDGAEYTYSMSQNGSGAFTGHIDADSSGSYQFAGLVGKDDATKTLAGTVSWTCSSA